MSVSLLSGQELLSAQFKDLYERFRRVEEGLLVVDHNIVVAAVRQSKHDKYFELGGITAGEGDRLDAELIRSIQSTNGGRRLSEKSEKYVSDNHAKQVRPPPNNNPPLAVLTNSRVVLAQDQAAPLHCKDA